MVPLRHPLPHIYIVERCFRKGSGPHVQCSRAGWHLLLIPTTMDHSTSIGTHWTKPLTSARLAKLALTAPCVCHLGRQLCECMRGMPPLGGVCQGNMSLHYHSPDILLTLGRYLLGDGVELHSLDFLSFSNGARDCLALGE